jgi:hypothetical protein
MNKNAHRKKIIHQTHKPLMLEIYLTIIKDDGYLNYSALGAEAHAKLC